MLRGHLKPRCGHVEALTCSYPPSYFFTQAWTTDWRPVCRARRPMLALLERRSGFELLIEH